MRAGVLKGDPNSAVEGSAAEQMRKAEGLESDGNINGAYNAYRALVKRYGLSVLAPKAQHKTGILLERSGQFDKAYAAYETYLTKYPRAISAELRQEPGHDDHRWIRPEQG